MIKFLNKSIFYEPNKEIIYQLFYNYINKEQIFLKNNYLTDKKYLLIKNHPEEYNNNIQDVVHLINSSIYTIDPLPLYFDFLKYSFQLKPNETIITIIPVICSKIIKQDDFLYILNLIPIQFRKNFLNNNQIKNSYREFIN